MHKTKVYVAVFVFVSQTRQQALVWKLYTHIEMERKWVMINKQTSSSNQSACQTKSIIVALNVELTIDLSINCQCVYLLFI